MERRILPGGRYRHFKGGLYQVITLAKHTETGEQMVIYQALYGDFAIYARPYDSFVSEVDHQKYPEAAQKNRFEEQEEADTPADFSQPLEQKAVINSSGDGYIETKDGRIRKDLYDFLEAKSYQEMMNVMVGMRNRLDESVLLNIAACLDISLGREGTPEEYYDAIVACIRAKERYEIRRS